MQEHTDRPVDIGSAISFGWNRFLANVGPLLLAALAVLAVQIVFSIIQLSVDGWFAYWLVQVASTVVSIIIAMGWIRIGLSIVDGRRADVADLFVVDDRFWSYVGASIVFGICFTVGLLLFIIPGVIIALIWFFYGYNIVDKGDSMMEAFARSSELTRGHKWELFVFMVVLVLLNIVGVLLLFVGVLVTAAISLIAVAYVYRRLCGEPVAEAA
jgi:uncharacterized membrane protein